MAYTASRTATILENATLPPLPFRRCTEIRDFTSAAGG